MAASSSSTRKAEAAGPTKGARAPRPSGASPAKGRGRPRDGASSRAERRAVRPEGLVIERWWTTAGVDPFDEVEWELRTAAITGERGEVIFEQRDLEIPKFWSQLATNVVASKYFRGPLGDPSREHSVRQLIGRVVRTIAGWGRQGGYFATEADADAFQDELTHLMLHQKASFNSPVWFNIGVEGAKPQGSACQPYHALVNTPSGLIPIGKLVEENAVGLAVHDSRGITNIVATKANGRKQVIRLHTKAGYTLDLTPDHRVWKVTGYGARGYTGCWAEAGTLRPGDRLAWHRTSELNKLQDATTLEVEAALAGWLQSDGFVGRYSGTNHSLTIEAMIVNESEETWVRQALAVVFPDVHSHTREVATKDASLTCRRIRLYGEALQSFVERWDLLTRGVAMEVPQHLFTAPLPVATAYLRSLFQAEGYVAVCDNARIGLDMISERQVRGVQQLLGRLGIYARVRFKKDERDGRKGCWSLTIRTLGDRERFAREISFLSPVKRDKLEASLGLKGLRAGDFKRLEIEHIEELGEMEVYDIQTASGEYLSGNIRIHNCFINSVDDNMESIMRLAATEARLFKGGSGTGSNLSTIRSSREPLAGGGIASGPVSFMRGYDSFAGAIKSGGKTRRAAKMTILDADHPDIIDFIQCKATEEKKAWALIEAGYNGGFNVPGGAYDSIFFQNANHSVRVSDEFMHAVESKGEWHTRFVLTRDLADTYKARDLLQMIADATHICGDPGMQFDTTINRWHTCKNTDRIYASNPCCITGDTLIAVADGRNAVAIRDLAGQTVPVYAWDHGAGKTVIAPMHNISVKRRSARVFRVTLDDGSSFRATDDHLIMLRDGSYRQVKDLKVGNSLNPFHSKVRQPQNTRTKRRHVYTGSGWRSQYRWVWEAAHGAQPEGFHIHHRDFDSLNDRLENLELILAADHEALHRDRMLGDGNPARRMMNDTWRANIAQAVSGEKNPRYGKPHSPEARARMRAASAGRWSDPEEHARAAARAEKWMELAREEGRRMGRRPGERYERCCPACRQNFITAREEQIFCSHACRYSPLGLSMIGEKGGEARRGRHLSPEHREKLRLTSTAAARPEDKRRGAEESLRSRCLKAARLLLDGGHDISLAEWDGLRETARGLGAPHVPQSGSLRRFFDSDAELREQAALYNHKVVSVEFDGIEDVYDGTVDGHHNFAIITSQTPSPLASEASDFSGCFIHNSEYMFLNDSACNLASINLLKFRRDDGEFDPEAFGHACEIIITAQEIIVDNASYPTEKIAQNSYDYRPLGLGYANLGALLMARGIPYDSDTGRAMAGAITALMTGAAYRQSARIASFLGPFAGFERNREPMLEVIGLHRSYVERIDASHVTPELLEAARGSWDDALKLGRAHGFRNSQATVLAPTGTIAFMMDCDTTGIEPDIALVKYKTLVGGGVMKIVNQTVPEALRRLGYRAKEVSAIIDYIDANGTIEGAPHLQEEDLPVFDCAFRAANGTRSIHYMGHLRMMAAAQPFLSGAISKTCNVPEDITVEEIEAVYLEAWKQGLKAVAIYRDGSKRTQPLSTAPGDSSRPATETRPLRRKLPDERRSFTHKFSIAGHEGYVTVGMYEDGTPGEIFIVMSKEGSVVSGLMDSFATAISLALQYGVPLRVLVNKFSHTRFEPSGWTNNKEIPIAKSVMDYIFRWLALKFLPQDEQPATPDSLSNGQAASALPANGYGGEVTPASAYLLQEDAPPCSDCGAIMVRNGACYRCLNCGSTSGCS